MRNYAENGVRTDGPQTAHGTPGQRLRALGLRPAMRSLGGWLTGGVAERVSVQSTLQEDMTAAALLQRLYRYEQAGISVCLSPTEFGPGNAAIDSWREFCELLCREGRNRGLTFEKLGFCVHSHQLPLEAFCVVPDSVFGPGPRFVFLDSLQMQPHCDQSVQERTSANWRFLWRCHRSPRAVLPVYGGFVRSACPLLSDEVATAVLPTNGLHAPVNSAWLSLELPLPNFMDQQGRLEDEKLVHAATCAVPAADELFDQVRWVSPMQKADARDNRRLGFILTGIGDAVLQGGGEPGDLRCLRRMARTIGRVRTALGAASAKLASQSGAVPSLARARPAGDWFDGSHRETWARHFEEACRRTATRHRNLLVISPYAVLPHGEECSVAFADLLPIISLADAWNFSAPPSFTGWNITQFKRFHCRARAIIQGSHSTSRIAAGV